MTINSTIRLTPYLTYFPSLEKLYREGLKTHLKLLSDDDRYFRFCSIIKDEDIDKYVSKLDFNNDAIIVIFDESSDKLQYSKPIIGFLHVTILKDKNECEFSFSVSNNFRRQGLGNRLFQHGLLFAQSLGIKTIYTNCLGDNIPMRRIVEKNGFKVTGDFKDLIGKLTIEKSESELFASLAETTQNNFAIFDLNYRSLLNQFLRFI
jgi:RimJ/RimL family protein N-acetyltransferase